MVRVGECACTHVMCVRVACDASVDQNVGPHSLKSKTAFKVRGVRSEIER